MTNVSNIADCGVARMIFAKFSPRKLTRRLGILGVCCTTLALSACDTARGPVLTGPQSTLPQTADTYPESTVPFPEDEAQISALPEATEAIAQDVRIGVLLPLSGQAADAGQGLRNAALLAQFDVNTPNLILQYYDTKGTAEGAQAAAQTAIGQGASLLVGPLFSHSVQAVAPIAQAQNVPVLSLSANPQAAADNVFVTGFLIRPQIERIIGFAIAQGRQNFAVLAPTTPYGEAAAQAAEAAIQQFGGTLVRSARFDSSKVNYSQAVRELSIYDQRKDKLKQEIAKLEGKDDPASKAALKRLEHLDTLGNVDFDALVLPVAGSTLQQVTTLLKYYDVDTSQVKLLGTLLWQDSDLGQERSLRGAWYPAASRVGFDSFQSRYSAAFRKKPSQLSTLSYDLVTLAAALVQHNANPWSMLTSPGGFIGVNGAFRLSYDGQVQRMLAVREVRGNGSVVISPAPTTFAAQADSPF